MYIGSLSKKTGLSIKAIRFYEDIGLIQPPDRLGRYRVYQQADVELLMLIKEAKALGVTLSQLKGVVVYKQGKIDWASIKVFLAGLRVELTQKRDDIQAKIANLDACYAQINA